MARPYRLMTNQISSLVKALILSFAGLTSIVAITAFASEYSQPGFYDVEQYRLDNGMRVIIKPRHNARNVSLHLFVNVGHMNFPCGKRETAHFLEHLLFAGTSEHSEVELQELIESNGGNWNAETAKDYTLYYIDIFSKNVDVALKTLHEIITRSTITPENVEKSRKIVYRESGGKPAALRSWLYENGIIVDAVDRTLNLVFPGIDYQCKVLDNNAAISREDILDAYNHYYVADNMSLAIVGDITIDEARRLVADTFGSMPVAANDGVRHRPLPGPFEPFNNNVEGRFHPIVDSEASVFLVYRTGGIYSPHYYALTVLEAYFYTELYNRLRVNQGLAYAPDTYMYMHNDYGAFVLETDSELDDTEKSIQLIKATINEYKQGHLDQARLDSVKRKILLNAARGYESNSSFSEYYALSAEELNRYGRYENYEDGIEKVTMKDIQEATNAYFNDDNLVTTIVKPTVTYTQFYVLILVLIVLLSLAAWRVVKMLSKRRSK